MQLSVQVKACWQRFKVWLILQLGGYPELGARDHAQHLILKYIPREVRLASERAFNKVQKDPSFKGYEGSNLGRNIKRDEAAEWTKLYLKDAGMTWRDSDVNLACELLYHLANRL